MIILSVGIFLLNTFVVVLPAVHSSSADRPVFVQVISFIIIEVIILAILVAFWLLITAVAMISKRNKTLYAQYTLTVGDGGYVSESEYGRSETKWKMIQKLRRTRRHIIMYISGDSAVIVPRRAFESTAQWDAFYDICVRGRSGVA